MYSEWLGYERTKTSAMCVLSASGAYAWDVTREFGTA